MAPSPSTATFGTSDSSGGVPAKPVLADFDAISVKSSSSEQNSSTAGVHRSKASKVRISKASTEGTRRAIPDAQDVLDSAASDQAITFKNPTKFPEWQDHTLRQVNCLWKRKEIQGIGFRVGEPARRARGLLRSRSLVSLVMCMVLPQRRQVSDLDLSGHVHSLLNRNPWWSQHRPDGRIDQETQEGDGREG